MALADRQLKPQDATSHLRSSGGRWPVAGPAARCCFREMHHPYQEERQQPPARLPSVRSPSWNAALPGGWRKRRICRPGPIPAAAAAVRATVRGGVRVGTFVSRRTPRVASAADAAALSVARRSIVPLSTKRGGSGIGRPPAAARTASHDTLRGAARERGRSRRALCGSARCSLLRSNRAPAHSACTSSSMALIVGTARARPRRRVRSSTRRAPRPRPRGRSRARPTRPRARGTRARGPCSARARTPRPA